MKLNFGCGDDIKEGYDNCDIKKGKGIISFDFDKFPYPFKDNSYDYVLMKQVIEHLLYPDRTLIELHRICKNGATIRIETAHYTNKGAYSDIQHLHFFNENVFENFIRNLSGCRGGFRIKELKVTPTIIGKFMPESVRKYLSLFFGGLQSQIHCEYEVIKEISKK